MGCVIVLGTVEHDRATLERFRIFRIRQIAGAELVEITLVFMIAESNRFPRSTVKPARVFIGSLNGLMTFVSTMLAPRQLSASVLPLTVSVFSLINP